MDKEEKEKVKEEKEEEKRIKYGPFLRGGAIKVPRPKGKNPFVKEKR
jgi:hypothetical protein